MKKKILKISIILMILFLAVAVVFFFLMKNATPEEPNGDVGENDVGQGETEEYDVSHIVEKIEFLKLNTYDEIEEYADEYPIYIQTSSDATLFAIGELYIEDSPVKLFYKLNADGSINRFDGSYSIKLESKSADEVVNVIEIFNSLIANYFSADRFGYSVYDESGTPLIYFDDQMYTDIFDGSATYSLSIIDESNTYWHITIVVTDNEFVDFEFFRCFDLSVYNDDSPDIDLRIKDEIGEGNYEEETEE